MRLSPNGRRFVYVAGTGLRPASPMVTVVEADGRSVAIEPGHSPRWSSDGGVVWGPQEDGRLRCAIDVPVAQAWRHPFDFALVSGNAVAAAAGAVAVYRTDPRRVELANGRVIPGAMDPAISDDGVWLAYVRPDEPREGVSRLVVERVDGSGAPPRVLYEGAPTRPRFGGTTLAWEVGRGLLAACPDVSNPAVPATHFTFPSAWRCYHPVPVWVPTRGELLLLFLADDGVNSHLKLATWTSMRLGEPRGYALGVSTGSGYDHDARPVGLDQVAVQWLDPLGVPDGVRVTLTGPRATLEPPTPPVVEPPPVLPPALPDQPFVVDPAGVVEDMAPWLFSPDQGPDVHLSPDGRIRFFCKSDEGSGDGRDPHIGEHWDLDERYVGHLDDASTGRRILDGQEVIAEDIVARFPNDHARVWASLPINHNWFADGRRLWMPRRCVSGTSIRYVTDITWTVPPRETPHTRVWKNIPIEIRVDVGYGVINGKEVRVRSAYIPDGNEEVSFYGPPKGYNAWVAGPVSWESDPWSAK